MALERLSRNLPRPALEFLSTRSEARVKGAMSRGGPGERDVAFTETKQESLASEGSWEALPGGPGVKMQCFQCRGHGFDPW